MKLEYFGHSGFRIKNEQGVTIFTDPYTRVGYELPTNLQANIVTVSHGHFDHNYVAAVGGSPVVVAQAGEYICKGVKIVGEQSWHDQKQGALRGGNIIFKMEIDGLTVCHFGDLGEAYSEELAEKLSGTDIWLIPVGGTYTIDAMQAKEYVQRLAPKIVIPMHYRPLDGTLDITDASPFLKGAESVVHCPQGEIEITQADLEEGRTKIIYMERKK